MVGKSADNYYYVYTDVASKSSSVGIGLGEVSMLTIILGSLLGATTLLLVATTIALICFIAANLKLKKKVKQFARSHSRYI